MHIMYSISKVLDVLNYRNRADLANLLKGAKYDFTESSQYGTQYCSLLTTVNIYSDIQKQENLEKLGEGDRKTIINAFTVIHPVRDNDIEINRIKFFVDPDAPIPISYRAANRLNSIDYEYISSQIQKCDDKINYGDYEGAITNARTLLESVCKYILDSKLVDYENKNELPSLYKKVSVSLNMDPSTYPIKSIKEILAGCFSIVNGISNVRNELSDSHGKSRMRHYKPTGRHAILTVNISKAISEYLFASFIENPENKINADNSTFSESS